MLVDQLREIANKKKLFEFLVVAVSSLCTSALVAPTVYGKGSRSGVTQGEDEDEDDDDDDDDDANEDEENQKPGPNLNAQLVFLSGEGGKSQESYLYIFVPSSALMVFFLGKCPAIDPKMVSTAMAR